MKIPKLIHQIWFQGENNIPPHLKIYQNKCRSMYSNWDYKFWDKENIELLIKKEYNYLWETYTYYPKLIQKIDLAKYIILHKYGGFYLDMDVECLQNIDNFILQYPNSNFMVSSFPSSINKTIGLLHIHNILEANLN